MGGGDLNLKKSWHPHTLKNQERVWKAEQQKAEEDRKVAELQREIKEEREREMLQKTAEDSGAVEKKGDAKLDWMYKGPGGHVSREEYLLGRKIDASFDQLEKAEAEEKDGDTDTAAQQNKPVYTIEHEINPESVVRRESANLQVDMRRKLLEDPLLLIRQREEETKREITANPVKMKQLQQLISSIKSKKSIKKKKKRTKKKKRARSSSSSSSSESGSDERSRKKKKKKKSRKKAATSSDSSDSSESSSSSDSSEEERKRKKKKLKIAKSMMKHGDKEEKVKRHGTEFSEEDRGELKRNRMLDGRSDFKYNKNTNRVNDNDRHRNFEFQRYREFDRNRIDSREPIWNRGKDRQRDGDRNWERSRSRESSADRFRGQERFEKYGKQNYHNRFGNRYEHHRDNSRSRSRSRERKKYGEGSRQSDHYSKDKKKLSEREMDKKRQEMVDAARKRDADRKENVLRYAEERKKEEETEKNVDKFRRSHLLTATSRGTIEDRVKSKVGSSQRGSAHMETNFARK